MKWHQVLLRTDIPDVEADDFLKRIYQDFADSHYATNAGIYYHERLSTGEHLYYFPPASISFHAEALRQFRSVELDSAPNIDGIRRVDLSK